MPTSSFFNSSPTTYNYTLSLHDALPISCKRPRIPRPLHFPHHALENMKKNRRESFAPRRSTVVTDLDRKSTRLNSSHRCISYAVFCLKKKKKKKKIIPRIK